MISHVESGHSSLLLDGAAEAGRKLGVSLDYLVGLTDDPTPSAELSMAEITPEIPQLPGARPLPVRRLQTAAGSGTLDLDERGEGLRLLPARMVVPVWSGRGSVQHHQRDGGIDGADVAGRVRDPCRPKRKRRLKGHIVVVRKSDGLVVKRAGKDGSGNWLLASDHPAWASEPWGDAEVISEVN